jgi:hypothetical protein
MSMSMLTFVGERVVGGCMMVEGGRGDRKVEGDGLGYAAVWLVGFVCVACDGAIWLGRKCSWKSSGGRLSAKVYGEGQIIPARQNCLAIIYLFTTWPIHTYNGQRPWGLRCYAESSCVKYLMGVERCFPSSIKLCLDVFYKQL